MDDGTVVWESNTVGRYRNSDPVLMNYLVRLGVEGRGEEYHSFPQRALFDIREDFNVHLHSKSMSFFDSQQTGELMSRDVTGSKRVGKPYIRVALVNDLASTTESLERMTEVLG